MVIITLAEEHKFIYIYVLGRLLLKGILRSKCKAARRGR